MLAANHQNDAAEAELAALLPELPPSANAHTRLGYIYFKLGDAHRALAEFQHARQLDRNFAPAYAGSGAVALQAGDYPAAKRYLTDAVRLDDQDANSRTLLDRAEQLLAADPFSPRSERGRAGAAHGCRLRGGSEAARRLRWLAREGRGRQSVARAFPRGANR